MVISKSDLFLNSCPNHLIFDLNNKRVLYEVRMNPWLKFGEDMWKRLRVMRDLPSGHTHTQIHKASNEQACSNFGK